MAAEFLGAPASWIPYVRMFVQRAYPIGEDLDVYITSWHRTRAHNAAVGGDPSSQHLVGTAWDIAGPDQDVYAARARASGLVVVDEGDHIHVQLFTRGVVPDRLIQALSIA